MLTLAAANVLGAVVFAGVYAASSAVGIAPATFVAGLLVAFAGVTAVWVRIEQQSPTADGLRRVGRVTMALLLVVIGLPIAVLMPLFWLESQLPLEAVPELHLGSVMALLLVSLILVVAVNVVGSLVTMALGIRRRWRARPAR